MASHGIKERAASRSFRSNYSSISTFITSGVEDWALKLFEKSMISDSSFRVATNPAVYATGSTKAVQMLQDMERYIKSSTPDLFWDLVHMISEKELAQPGGGGKLAQKLAAAYKANGGGDEIDSALAAPSDEHDAPKRFISQQPSSHDPPRTNLVLRSQTEPPLPIPVQESTAAAQAELVTPGDSPVGSRSPSLPTAVEEQSYGSLQGIGVFEDDAIPEESDLDPLQHCPPEGNGPSVSPSSSAPQVDWAQGGGAAETVVRQRVGDSVNERSQGPHVRRLPSAGTPPPSAGTPPPSAGTPPPSAATPPPSPHPGEPGSAPPNLAATLQQCKMPLLVVVFLVLCGGITIGMFTVWKDEPGGLGRASIQSCPNVHLDYTRSQPLMRILEEEVVGYFSDHWHQVGTQLEVPTAKLTELEKDNPTDVKARLREVIKFWLKGNGREPHKLGTLAHALDASHCPKAAQNLLTHPELCKEIGTTEE